jgi:hypothetical protein
MVLSMPFSGSAPPPQPQAPLQTPGGLAMPDISAMLDGMLKPPTQPKYAPGYTKPKKPEVGEIVTRATNAKEASSAFLDQVQDTMERLRPGLRAGYFKRDEEAFFHGDIEVYQSTALIDAKSKLDAYLAARPIAYSVDVYDPEVYVDAQRIEDAAYHFRKLHERRWVEAGNMTLSQSEAKDLTLYGVVVSRRTLNLADTRCPITATLIDPATVFPLWGRVGNVPHLEAIYRIVTMPVYQVMADYALDEARARKIKDALGDKIGHFGASADVTVVEYWDSWWCGAFLFEGSVEIKPLTEHKYGCVPFVIQYGPGGEPMHTRSPQRGSGYMYNYAFGSRTNRDDRVYKATGYIEPMKRLHDVREAITGSYMNNLLKGFEQPVILEQTNSAAEAPEPPIIDRSAGGVTRLVGGEEQLKPFPTSPNPADAGLVMQMIAMDSQTNLQTQGDMPDRSNISGSVMARSSEQGKELWDGWVQALESFHGRCATHDMLLWRNFGQEARYLSGTKKSFYVPNRNPAADEKPSFELTPEMIDNVDTDIAVLMNDMSLSELIPFGQAAQMFGPDGMQIWSSRDIARKMGKTDFDRTRDEIRTEVMLKRVMEMEETGKLILVPQALLTAIDEATGDEQKQANLIQQFMVWKMAVMDPMMMQLQQASNPSPPPGMPGPQGPPQPGQGISGGGGAPYAALGQGPGSVTGNQGGPPGPTGPRPQAGPILG